MRGVLSEQKTGEEIQIKGPANAAAEVTGH